MSRPARPKRSLTQGEIRRRRDGRWEIRVRVDGRRRSYYAHTPKQAQEIRTQVLNQSLTNAVPKGDRRTSVGDFLAEWLQNSVRPSVRPLTYEQYEQHVRLYLAPRREKDDGSFAGYRPAPTLGSFRLLKLDAADVQRFLNAQLKKDLSPRTVQLSLVILRRALDTAVRQDLITRNVAKLVDPPRVTRTPVQVLSPQEVKQFILASEGNDFEAAFILAIALGLRRGEVLGLRWSDIDLDARTLTVAQALSRIATLASPPKTTREPQTRHANAPVTRRPRSSPLSRLFPPDPLRAEAGALPEANAAPLRVLKANSTLQLTEPKSSTSRRSLNLPTIAVGPLRARKAAQAEQRLIAGPSWQDNQLVFTTGIGTPMEPRRLHSAFKTTLAQAGLPSSVRFHDLRHCCASLLLAQGVPARAVMELLGHSQISLTMNTYSHVMPAMMREVADKIDRALSP